MPSIPTNKLVGYYQLSASSGHHDITSTVILAGSLFDAANRFT
jgi:hypothetical protein